MKHAGSVALGLSVINTVLIAHFLIQSQPRKKYTFTSFKAANGAELPVRINDITGETDYFYPGKGWIKERELLK